MFFNNANAQSLPTFGTNLQYFKRYPPTFGSLLHIGNFFPAGSHNTTKNNREPLTYQLLCRLEATQMPLSFSHRPSDCQRHYNHRHLQKDHK